MELTPKGCEELGLTKAQMDELLVFMAELAETMNKEMQQKGGPPADFGRDGYSLAMSVGMNLLLAGMRAKNKGLH